jgi:hypothetical protein
MIGRSLASTILVAVFAFAAPTATTALPAAGCAACSIQSLVPSDVKAAYYSRYRYGRSRGMSPYRMSRGARYGRGSSYWRQAYGGRGDRHPSNTHKYPPNTLGIGHLSPVAPPDRRFAPTNSRPEGGGSQYGYGYSQGPRQFDGPPGGGRPSNGGGGSQGGGGGSQSGGGSSTGGGVGRMGGGGSPNGADGTRPPNNTSNANSTVSTATSAQEQRRFLCERMDERQRRLIACCQPPYLQECSKQ